MRTVLLSLLLLGLFPVIPAVAAPAPGAVTLTSATFADLARLPIGGERTLEAFPVGSGVVAGVRLERIEVYAPDARIVEIGADGKARDLPRSRRVQLLGTSSDGTVRLGLSFDPDQAEAPSGAGVSAAGPFELHAERVAGGWRVSALSPEAALPPGVVPQFPENVDSLPSPLAEPELLSHLSAGVEPNAASTPARLAVVAIDTDPSLLSARFGNNTTQATAWIADLFTQMNVIYRRDLDVILLQGTTFLRVGGTDPFPTTGSPASSAQLSEFGSYWQANYSSGSNAVSRSFAALLSGKSSSGNSASGIAWVNAYCKTQSSGGSYSVNQVFTNSAIAVSSSVFIVAHEIGHNFGAAHTHCANASTGAWPTASNTIDQCYNAEGSCYAGTPTCPTGGPSPPKGSLMSYCHIGGSNGANCGSNVLQFHATHATQLRNLVASNTPSCLKSELIFQNGFQTP